MSQPETTLSTTESLCPVCLRKVDAAYVAHVADGPEEEDDEGIYLEKSCPEHGFFSTLVWNGPVDDYLAWVRAAGPLGDGCPSGPHVPSDAGCPFACGMCDLHQSETFTAALMVTNRCNLNCPVCFNRSQDQVDQKGQSPLVHDPSLEDLERRLAFYLETSGGPFPLELCGGEPTVRDDLPDIARAAKQMGFTHIQLNTNGLRIGRDPDYAIKLAESGVDTVYLSFDGLGDAPYIATCGRPLARIKQQAVENLMRTDIGIVLVPVLSPETNADQLGRIIQFALERVPSVRGVNIQPFARLGSYSAELDRQTRVTIPDILDLIERSTDGLMKRTDFNPGGVEHALCSFQATYLRGIDGTVKPITHFHVRENNNGAAAVARTTTAAQWHKNMLPAITVGGMIFQDAFNVDIARLRRCPTHIIGDGMLYPLCAKYLTAQDGTRLYPGID